MINLWCACQVSSKERAHVINQEQTPAFYREQKAPRGPLRLGLVQLLRRRSVAQMINTGLKPTRCKMLVMTPLHYILET